jgi:hypothetical protein
VLYSKECHHLVEISQLDAINLHGVYEAASDGSLTSINAGSLLQNLHTPRCICGALLDCRRYRIHAQLMDFDRVLDLLIGKIGRQLAGFTTGAGIVERQLVGSFKAFFEAIRPNPLAGKTNASLLLKRPQDCLDLQRRILKFRREVVDGLHISLSRLHETLPNVIPSYLLPFQMHCEIIELRVVSIRLLDSLQVGARLRTLQDPSLGTHRQGLALIEFTSTEATAKLHACTGMLADAMITTTPILETELRLLQLHFLLLIRCASMQLTDGGDAAQKSTMCKDDEVVTQNLEALTKLIQSPGGKCGAFSETLESFTVALASTDVLQPELLPRINNSILQQAEKPWLHHAIGHVTVCGNRHAYSSKTFAGGCPYCEKQFQPVTAEMIRASAKHLFEDDFLEAMRARSPLSLSSHAREREKKDSSENSNTTKTDTSEEPVKNTDMNKLLEKCGKIGAEMLETKTVDTLDKQGILPTQEEKFLAAMKGLRMTSANGSA